MKINSTQITTINASKEVNKQNIMPSKLTINFIKQFARSYNHNHKLHPSFDGIIVN